MQRPGKRPHDSDEPHDAAVIRYPAPSSSVARAEALSETALTKRQKTDENPAVARGPGHTFDRSIACDNSRVQYGDTYNVYHRAPEPEPQTDGWQEAMKVLRFPQMDVRRQTVKDAHAGTCAWIFEKPEYKSWCDSEQIPLHHGFLWIKSKPGAGKSTLMKFLLDVTEQQSSPNQAVISFFFNARGDLLERSLEGMYRQLLHQLLTVVARLRSVISPLEINNLASLNWPRQLLENMFKKCVLSMVQERVTCFIDALDECPEEEIRELIEFFENLGNMTAKNGICIRICFSSRHYPNVSLEKCQHFMLDGQSGHLQDISAYIKSKLRLCKSQTNEKIRADVQKRAQGVFLWVVLVVKRLNQDVDRGDIHNLRRSLDEVPDGLDALFRDTLMLTSDNDGMLVQMMQWMMYACRTLTLQELYFGVHIGALLTGTPEPWDRNEIPIDVMERFIVNCSRGLVELTAEPVRKVQFIHESVRDYLFGSGLGLIAPDISKNFEGTSHDYLKRTCLRMFTTSTIGYGPKDRLRVSTDMDLLSIATRRLLRLFPLLMYACGHVLDHAELASQCGVNQSEFVSSFPLHLWNLVRVARATMARLETVVTREFSMECRFWCRTKAVLKEGVPAESKTEAFICANARNLLEYELHPDYPLLTPVEHVQAIHTAVVNCPESEVQILVVVLKRGAVADLSRHHQEYLLDSAVRRQRLQALKALFDSGIRIYSGCQFTSLLSQSLEEANSALTRVLLGHETDVGP